MKKNLIPLATIALTVSILASCGTTTSNKIDCFIYQFSDTYIGTVRTALNTDLTAKGYTPTFYDAAAVQQTQTQQIETVLASGTNIMLVNAVEQTAIGTTISDKAKTAKVPVIYFNREVDDSAVTAANYPDACFVGTDPDQAGYMQGDILAGALITSDNKLSSTWDRNGDGKINYVMIRADESNAEANGRTTYSVQECNTKLTAAGLSSLHQLGSDVNASWSKDTAKTTMDTFISTYGLTGANGIECVIANNDDMALGAIASLQTANFNKGGTDNVLVVGVDATSAAVSAIDSGYMYGTVKQDAAAMATCITELAANKLSGKDYLDGTSYSWEDTTSAVHKIRIPYSSYTKA